MSVALVMITQYSITFTRNIVLYIYYTMCAYSTQELLAQILQMCARKTVNISENVYVSIKLYLVS